MFEVEEAAVAHPEVLDAAAYGIPSAELESESELILRIVRAPGSSLSPEAVASFINANAPYYFVPRYIGFIDSLPRNPHGRLLKQELRDQGLPQDAWDRKNVGFKVRR
jgi:crotonobetaine/carnitine-CoA ligase